MTMRRIIGRCSECRGLVTLSDNQMSTVPPVARCDDCGAVKEETLPIIKMISIRKVTDATIHAQTGREISPKEDAGSRSQREDEKPKACGPDADRLAKVSTIVDEATIRRDFQLER